MPDTARLQRPLGAQPPPECAALTPFAIEAADLAAGRAGWRGRRLDGVIHLLNLLAAIALLVWGTYQVRTGVLRVAGANLRQVLARSFGNRVSSLLAGLGVTSLVQSSTATCLIVASFVGNGLVGTAAALAVMLDVVVGALAATRIRSSRLAELDDPRV